MNKIVDPSQVFINENIYYHMDKKLDYTSYYVSVTNENMGEVTYEELIALRDLINDLEKRHNEVQKVQKGGAQ